MGIVEFLEARIAEDEAVAKAATGLNWHWKPKLGDDDDSEDQGPWLVSDEMYEMSGGGSYPETVLSTWVTGAWCGLVVDDADQAQIVRHDPARILREIAAKRAVVVEHKLVPAKNVWGESTGGCGCELCDSTPDLDLGGIEIERSDGCKTLRTLAVIFSDHPDFDEEWRP